jgi:urea carboxylase-associated protein 1
MKTIFEQVVPAKEPWSRVIATNDILMITNLEGQQAVDFLCYDANDLTDRYSTMNTIKVQGNVYVGLGTVLYSDSGAALMTVTEDTVGRHDTIYGCCSAANNRLRYGVETTETCYSNFEHALAEHGLGKDAIVSNVNWFMSVPVLADGSAGIARAELQPQSYVSLRAETDVLAVLSNCPEMHNPCNGYKPSPIKVTVLRG